MSIPSREKPALRALVLFVAAAALLAPLLPGSASAMPFFSRQVGRDCSYCHSLVPRLNETGREFRQNGYRFEGELDWKGVREYEVLPVAIEVEVEALYNRTRAGGEWTEESDIKVEEVEIMAGGVVDKDGRVSALAQVAVQDATGAADVTIPKAFVQVNDLAGPPGAGRLNARAGKWDVGLPFLNPTAGTPISNSYLLDTDLSFLPGEEVGVELNGAWMVFEDGGVTAHRYAAGLTREDLGGDDKLRGWYAWYSVAFNETVSLGAVYRGGEEAVGSADVWYNKYGAAAEADLGPAIVTAGYFRSERAGLTDIDDYVAEVLFFPITDVSVGARYEFFKEEGLEGARSQTLMARYHIMSNVYAQAEARALQDNDHVVGTNEDETKGRLFLVAVF